MSQLCASQKQTDILHGDYSISSQVFLNAYEYLGVHSNPEVNLIQDMMFTLSVEQRHYSSP